MLWSRSSRVSTSCSYLSRAYRPLAEGWAWPEGALGTENVLADATLAFSAESLSS